MDGVSISPEELAAWSALIREICGVHLDASKAYLVETRLAGLLRETGARRFGELYEKARVPGASALKGRIIDAITTNETSFFRDQAPFELLRQKLIPDILDRRERARTGPAPIRIWSAACSTGQEAYSMAIVIREWLGDQRGWEVRILGTDISEAAIARARRGQFSRQELDRGMSRERIARHFIQAGNEWRVRDEVKSLTTFKTMNLLDPFSFPAPFDIIFCRNVAIYFKDEDKVRLFAAVRRSLTAEGRLVIGSTESIAGLCPEFEPKRYQRSVYYELKRQHSETKRTAAHPSSF